jgi:hypothetical protein
LKSWEPCGRSGILFFKSQQSSDCRS